jgi:eukaryotic-like serine/threonine-protein kinase
MIMTATAAGAILGTAGYMSPEQAKGKKADARADIWAFGVVLYEMLTGKRAFEGETASEILAAVMMAEPDFDRLPSATPVSIRRLLRRCLNKDPRQRLQAIGEARIVIEDDAPAQEPVVASPFRRALPWALAMLSLVASGLALWGWLRPASESPRPVMRFTMALPGASALSRIQLSPDGSRLAYSGGTDGPIYVRRFDDLVAKRVAGGEDGDQIQFSRDGQWIGFRAATTIKKIPLNGGAPYPVGDFKAGPFGFIWLQDGSLVFSREGALIRAPADGGKVETLATPENHGAYNALDALPDGRNLLIAARREQGGAQLQTLDLQTGRKKSLLELTGGGFFAKYAATEPRTGKGHIIYQRTNSWFAVAFDPAHLQLTGSPFPVLEEISLRRGQTIGTFSDSGTLVYIPATTEEEYKSTLTWVDRSGAAKPLPAAPQGYASPSILPDGGSVAVTIAPPAQPMGNNIAVFDLARGTLTRLTSVGNNGMPIWTPDGKRLTYRTSAIGPLDVIATIPADGPGDLLDAHAIACDLSSAEKDRRKHESCGTRG